MPIKKKAKKKVASKPNQSKANGVSLNIDQKKMVLENYDKYDLKTLTRMVFGNNTLSGLSKEGRAIRSFLVENELEYKTTKWEKVDRTLSEEDRQFIDKNAELMGVLEIAKILFPEVEGGKNITGLSKEVAVIQQYIADTNPEALNKQEDFVTDNYSPPNCFSRIIPRIRKYMNIDLKEKDLDIENKKNLEKLIQYLNDFRLIKTINAYQTRGERDLFESSFISNTWDKPDLTQSDIQSYINLAVNYVMLHNALKQKALMDRILSEGCENNSNRISSVLIDALDKTQKFYENTEKRINDIVKNLEGTRNERLKNQIEKNRSILVLVDAFCGEKTRQQMVRVAEYEKMLVEKEADKIERASDYIVKMYGVSKAEALGG
jgi:hypothetical protein